MCEEGSGFSAIPRATGCSGVRARLRNSLTLSIGTRGRIAS
ncbi:hypothetical protein EVA_03658 [gut metagenome]|uniref:Uncharacterized protein n=1 Tax=gut metagenome TaxID=749906 RepID=J9GYG8_9ZZZZ